MPEHFYNVKPEMLLQMGVSGLICDIDNTLATYEQPDPPEHKLQHQGLVEHEGGGGAHVLPEMPVPVRQQKEGHSQGPAPIQQPRPGKELRLRQ